MLLYSGKHKSLYLKEVRDFGVGKKGVKMANKNPKLYENYDQELTKRLEKKLLESPIEPSFNKNAISILGKRYFKKDENGTFQENINGLCARVSANIAYPDFHYTQGDEGTTTETAKTFYEMMMKKEFMPNSPTLMNAGRSMQQLSACFVIPIKDEMEGRGGIMMGVYDTGLIHKSGGGTGFSFSNLRRKNDFVSSTYGKSSGPVSFIQMYDAATNAVNQGGFRRGANMGILRVDHPDILEFMFAKENEKETRYNNFNFSVAITDEFMNALKNKGNYILKNPRRGEIHELKIDDIKNEEQSVKQGLITQNERILIVEDKKVIYQNPIKRDIRGRILEVERKEEVGKVDDKGRITLNAEVVFDYISKLAWGNGEPGIAFLDQINRKNPTPALGEVEATNPCGEQPLLPYEACNLGSINLGLMIKDGKIDYSRLENTVKHATHFLDNVVDMSKFPLKEITDMVHVNRKIGLGVMGFADLLYELKIPYNSDQALEKAEEIMGFIQNKSVEESQRLAEKRGAFSNFKKSVYASEKKRRNATVTTIAPTGTISIIAGASSGIEPSFELVYTHKDADGIVREFKNNLLVKALKDVGINPDKVFEEMINQEDDQGNIVKRGKSLKELDFVPDEIKKVFVTTEDISVDYHVKMQAAFQKYTENAVSKTINFPNSATVEEVKKAYFLAHELGCKGITVYRKGSREEEVLKKMGGLEEIFHYIEPKKRPEALMGSTIKKRTGCGNLFITTNYVERNGGTKDLFEIFASMGKAGGCASCQNEATGRLTSELLRSGANPRAVASQLIGIRCHKPFGFGPKAVYSCADAIGRSIAEFYGEEVSGPIGDSENFENLLKSKKSSNKKKGSNEKINDVITEDNSITGGACPSCGSTMQIKEGCLGGVCSNIISCGYSECS